MQPIKSLTFFFALVNVAFSQTLADPDNVPIATRDQWCLSQRTQCPYICTQLKGTDGSPATDSNTCEPTDLSYSCVCSNGESPNITQYSETIPYFICTENNNECVMACGNSNICASNCRTQNLCGAQSPVRVNTSTITSTMSATGSGGAAASATGSGAVYTGFGGSGSTAATGSSGGDKGNGAASQAILHMGRVYGVALLLAGFFAGFAIL